MKNAIFIILWSLVPFFISAQITDTVVKLPVVVIVDSTLRKAVPTFFMHKEVFEQSPTADIGEILTHQSSIGGIRKGGYAIDPVIRGYRYSQIKIFLDEGTHIEGGCPNRMDPVMAHLEPEQIEELQIVKGPYLMEYGSSPAASIRIATRKGAQHFSKGFRLSGITGYETNRDAWRQNISIRESNGRYYYALSGGLKKSGNYEDAKGVEWQSSYNKYYMSADAGLRNEQGSVLLISWKGSFTRDVMFPALPMDEIIDNTHIFSGFYVKHYPSDPSKSINLSVYHTSVYHFMDNSFRPQHNSIVPPLTGIMQSEAGVNTRSSGLRAAFADEYHGMNVETGIDMHMINKNGTREMKMIMQMGGQEYTNLKYTNLWNNSVILSGGVFGKINYEKNKLNYNATIRLDVNHSYSGDTLELTNNGENIFNHNSTSRVFPSLSAGILHHTSRNLNAGVAFAYSMRAPDMQERYIKFLATGYDRFDYLGNPQLKPETNIQADLMLNYLNESVSVSLNLFASCIIDYITGILLPPSIARPQSLGAPGVKQFSNLDKAIFTGFEVSGNFRPNMSSQLSFSAGYTLAWYPEIEKIILENNQAIGTTILKNDPVAEMPALEAELQYKYNIAKLKINPVLIIRATSSQNMISESYGEESTPGYIVADFSTNWMPSKIITVSGGVKNIFNTCYYDHLNRRLVNTAIKLYEPGRSFYILLKITI